MASESKARKKGRGAGGNGPRGDPGSGASLYGRFYFEHYLDQPYERTEEWLQFFAAIAERIASDIAPKTVLDAGCAMGFLVEAFRDRGIEAYGVDISEYAIERVRPDVRPYCWCGSLTDPLPREYDLIVCIEVLEHLTPADGERAVANLCSHAPDIVFSSTPDHFRDATHVNVQPPEYWAALFGRHGFFRDADLDLSYVSLQAARFRRTSDPVSRALAPYERLLWRLKQDNLAMHELAGEHRVELARIASDLEAAQEQVAAWQVEIEAKRQQAAELQAQLEAAREELRAARNELDSRSVRLAQTVRSRAQRLFPADTRHGRWLRRAIGSPRGPAQQ